MDVPYSPRSSPLPLVLTAALQFCFLFDTFHFLFTFWLLVCKSSRLWLSPLAYFLFHILRDELENYRERSLCWTVKQRNNTTLGVFFFFHFLE